MQLLNPKSELESLRLSEHEEAMGRVAPSALAFRIRVFDLIAILLFSIFMCLYNIGAGSFGGGDQTTHSLVVQHMHHFGDYLHPRYDGRPYFNKPPFKMWLVNFPVLLLGESTFSYRVIDGMCGVGIALCVFFFAQSLFASRLVAYFSVISLLGARVFFFGHGVRNAVQDGMMLYLMTLGTIAGWFFLERLRKAEKPPLWDLVLAGGVSVGLSVLTKNVAGFTAYIILGCYLLLNGEVMSVVKRSWKQLLSIAAISFAIPISYILAQGPQRKNAFEMLVITEVFKRATKGYHFVNHKWYYWNAIMRDRIAIPPEILVAGLLLGLFFLFRNKDRRYLFVLCWAFVPVLVQNAMKSKLVWYILPALPGMSLLAGALIGQTLGLAIPQFTRWFYLGLRPRFASFLALALGLVFSFSLFQNVFVLASEIAAPQRRNVTHEMVEDIQSYVKTSGKPVRALLYDTPTLANHETLYWNMEPIKTVELKAIEDLKQQLARNEGDFLLTRLEDLPEILPLRPITGYSFVPARNKRQRWLAVLSYNRDILPRNFSPATTHYVFGDDLPQIGFGFKYPGKIGSVRFRASSGDTSAMLLSGDIPQTLVGTTVRLSIASVRPSSRGKIDIDVFLNGTKISTLAQVEEGFHLREFSIPASNWRNGFNQLLFRYNLPQGEQVQPEQQLVFFESMDVSLQ